MLADRFHLIFRRQSGNGYSIILFEILYRHFYVMLSLGKQFDSRK